MKKLLIIAINLMLALTVSIAKGDEYKIDIEGMHAAINFKVRHIGISWLSGRFDKFDGYFVFDEGNPAASKVIVNVDVASVNSNHEARDAHIREENYLNVTNNPTAHFESTSIEILDKRSGLIHGQLTLNGVSNSVSLDAKFVGKGDDPWGGHRAAFEAKLSINPKDFDFKFEYGDVYLTLYLEGIRKTADNTNDDH